MSELPVGHLLLVIGYWLLVTLSDAGRKGQAGGERQSVA
jgi:hypothetical protein